MGYYADTIESDFVIPADKVAAALEAVNTTEPFRRSTPYASLDEAVRDWTTFESNFEDDKKGFALGYHSDKFLSYTDTLLGVLAPFAKDESFVRFSGEDHSLFGYRVRDGKLLREYAELTWRTED